MAKNLTLDAVEFFPGFLDGVFLESAQNASQISYHSVFLFVHLEKVEEGHGLEEVVAQVVE